MLGKLIKLDFMFGYKKFLAMAALLMVFGIVVPFLISTALINTIMLIYLLAMTVVCVMCIFLIVAHYQRNLFGAESYFMHTLPARPYQMLLSKLLTTVFWFNFMIGACMLMIVLLVRSDLTLHDFFARDTWVIFLNMLKAICVININVIPLILSIFMGIALATVAVRNKTIGIGFGITFSIIGVIACNWVSIKLSGSAAARIFIDNQAVTDAVTTNMAVPIWINLAVSAVFSTIFFFITTFAMKRKLNLK